MKETLPDTRVNSTCRERGFRSLLFQLVITSKGVDLLSRAIVEFRFILFAFLYLSVFVAVVDLSTFNEESVSILPIKRKYWKLLKHLSDTIIIIILIITKLKENIELVAELLVFPFLHLTPVNNCQHEPKGNELDWNRTCTHEFTISNSPPTRPIEIGLLQGPRTCRWHSVTHRLIALSFSQLNNDQSFLRQEKKSPNVDNNLNRTYDLQKINNAEH